MPAEDRRLIMNQTVVITGASTGIGRASALDLDRRGFQVVATVRKAEDKASLEAEASDRLHVLFLDVTDDAEIRNAATKVEELVGEAGLYGLVNNAGIAEPGPLEFLPIERLRRQMEVNVIGQVAVTQAFLPMLRRAQGRIVNIGSIGGRNVMPFAGAYCASKFALEALTDALRIELHQAGIHVSIIEPASVATPIWDKALDTDLPGNVEAHYGTLLENMKKAFQNASVEGVSADKVAEMIYQVLTTKRPKTRYLVGRMAYLRLFLQALPDRWRDRIILNRLT